MGWQCMCTCPCMCQNKLSLCVCACIKKKLNEQSRTKNGCGKENIWETNKESNLKSQSINELFRKSVTTDDAFGCATTKKR